MEILNRSVQVPKSEVAKFHSSQKDQIGNRSFFTEGNNTKPTSFKQVWRKAIEKNAPKQPTMLNEVSHKYEQKLAETRKGNQDYDEDDDDIFNQAVSGYGHNEQEKIKFVSMIDNKPIFPNYLDLVPMKNFTRKEQEAQRAQQKESIQQKDEKDNK